MTVLQKPMPVVVRLNRTKPHWQELQVSFAMDVRWSELPWFPGAWRCDAKDYDDSLRSQCSALNKSYALRFQEAASLVPPLLLEAVRPWSASSSCGRNLTALRVSSSPTMRMLNAASNCCH
ncbi:unnamed protein product [Durusdinium trenchii]